MRAVQGWDTPLKERNSSISGGRFPMGVVEEHHLRRASVQDLPEALGFVNRVGELAEEQGHHPT